MVKQSCTSANDRSCNVSPACSNACDQARAAPSNRVGSRRDSGRKSLTCAALRKRTALPMPRAVSSSVSTSAAAPSLTNEQSVRFSGGATYGFFSLTVRQNS